jgi:hypothetical protein
MTNPFYTRQFDVTPGNRVGSQAIEDEFERIEQAMDAVALAVDPTATTGTSTTSLTLGIGTKTFTTQADLAFFAGQVVNIARTAAPSTSRMLGIVTSYNSTTGAMVVETTDYTGAGTFTDWTISLGQPQAIELQPYLPKTGAFTITEADHGRWFDVTSGSFTITFDATGMENGFKCRIRNSGTGDVLIPASDGVSNWYMYPGEVRDFVFDGTAWKSTPLVAYVKTFTASTNHIQPPGYNGLADVTGVAGGGGGGSGRRGAAASGRAGGGGGGGGDGAWIYQVGGTGSGSTTNTNYYSGGDGGDAGVAGLGPLWAGAGGGGGDDNQAGGAGGNAPYSGSGGGAGGGIDTANALYAPGAGGGPVGLTFITSSGSGAAAGTSHATVPVAGTAGTTGSALSMGQGGGGGGASTGAAAAAGGAGGVGCGGGGGGASANLFASGAGGAGGRGELVVMGVL